ncbi:MAG: hypothetical protein EXR80_05620 [Methylococcales bacterium]|nr:hypothetical protein [Methylococcales bacterium]
MIFSLRPFVVIVLVLLQCIAPLVHAHTSEHFSAHGVHIPGLEGYGHLDSVALDTIPSATAVPCSVSSVCGDSEGQVVGIDTGLVEILQYRCSNCTKSLLIWMMTLV